MSIFDYFLIACSSFLIVIYLLAAVFNIYIGIKNIRNVRNQGQQPHWYKENKLLTGIGLIITSLWVIALIGHAAKILSSTTYDIILMILLMLVIGPLSLIIFNVIQRWRNWYKS